MNDKELIRSVWATLAPDLKSRVKPHHGIIRALPPYTVGYLKLSDDNKQPRDEILETIEFSAGPFGTVVGKWRDVVALV